MWSSFSSILNIQHVLHLTLHFFIKSNSGASVFIILVISRWWGKTLLPGVKLFLQKTNGLTNGWIDWRRQPKKQWAASDVSVILAKSQRGRCSAKNWIYVLSVWLWGPQTTLIFYKNLFKCFSLDESELIPPIACRDSSDVSVFRLVNAKTPWQAQQVSAFHTSFSDWTKTILIQYNFKNQLTIYTCLWRWQHVDVLSVCENSTP